MKKAILIICSLFILSFIYLHQKISLSIEAYKLSSNWKAYEELVAKRDALLYNFRKKVSLDKLNLWAESNSLKLARKENVLALTIQEQKSPRKEIRKAGFFVRRNSLHPFFLFREGNVLAEDKENQ